MNTTQARERLDYLAKKCGLTAEEKQKLIDHYFKWADNPVVNAAVGVIEGQKANHKLLQEILSNTLSGEMLDFYNKQNKPLIVINPASPIELLVYPNIIIDAGSSIEDINIINAATPLKSFITSLQADMADTKAALKWENQERIDKRLNQCLSMGVATVLTRYVSFQEKFKDSQIRDVANKIDEARKPLEVLFAETPEELAAMYLTGPTSCMAGERDSWAMLTAKGLGPSSFYAYFPWTKGAYIKKNGKIAARTILYKDLKNDSVWYYGRVYANSPDINNKLTEALRTHNITALNGKFAPPKDSHFTMPGVKHGNDFFAPMPYLDDINYYGNGFYVKFDKPSTTFHISFEPTNKLETVGIQLRDGVIKGSDYTAEVQVTCLHCSNPVNAKKALKVHNDDIYFCSEGCMNYQNYVYAATIQGHNIITKNHDDLVFNIDGGVKFTTEAAALVHGYSLAVDEVGVVAEEQENVCYAGDNRYVSNDKENRRTAWNKKAVRAADNVLTQNIIPIKDPVRRKNIELTY